MGKPKLPPHGTVRRYRVELRNNEVCDRCRSANTKAKQAERANRKARENRSDIHLVPDPQPEPTDAPTDDDAGENEAKSTRIPPGVRVDIGAGIENAVRNYLNSGTQKDLLAYVYGEIVITIARVISTAEPKDVPKLTEEMVDAAKLMQPADSSGGSDDPFAGLGVAT